MRSEKMVYVSSICVFFKLKQYMGNRIVIQQTSIEQLIYLNKSSSHTDVVGDYLVSMYANEALTERRMATLSRAQYHLDMKLSCKYLFKIRS